MFPVTVFPATLTLSSCSEMLLVSYTTTRIPFSYVVASDDLEKCQHLYHLLQHHILPISRIFKVLFRNVPTSR